MGRNGTAGVMEETVGLTCFFDSAGVAGAFGSVANGGKSRVDERPGGAGSVIVGRLVCGVLFSGTSPEPLVEPKAGISVDTVLQPSPTPIADSIVSEREPLNVMVWVL